MKPKPFSALNHLTVPVATVFLAFFFNEPRLSGFKVIVSTVRFHARDLGHKKCATQQLRSIYRIYMVCGCTSSRSGQFVTHLVIRGRPAEPENGFVKADAAI